MTGSRHVIPIPWKLLASVERLEGIRRMAVEPIRRDLEQRPWQYQREAVPEPQKGVPPVLRLERPVVPWPGWGLGRAAPASPLISASRIVAMRTTILLLAVAVPALAAEDDVLTRVAAHADHFGAVSRQIWESPEIGFHEKKSSGLLSDELGKAGFMVQEGVAGMPTAFVASWGSGKPVIAVLGEFDALAGPAPDKSTASA